MPILTLRGRSMARRLVTDRTGATATLFALAMPALIGFAGLGVDTGLWYVAKQRLQTAADAAALSAAYERAAGRPSSMQTAALGDARRNGFDGAPPETLSLRNPPATGAYAGDPAAVEATLSRPQEVLFSKMFLDGDLVIRARAVAHIEVIGQACVLGLDPEAPTAVLAQGSTQVALDGCTVAANSSSDTAISVSGNAQVSAQSLWTVGNYSAAAGSLSLAEPAKTHVWAVEDPYASATIPPFSGCTSRNLSLNNVTRTLSPGVYCGGLDIGAKADITFQPGIYIIDGGDIRINAQATVQGTDVTFILTSSGAASQIGTVVINGGATVNLTAPSDPDTGQRGLLFFQDRRASSTGTAKLNGGSSMSLFGAVYFPAQAIQFSGNNSSAGPECTQIIGRTVSFIGNSTVKNTGCAAAGVAPIRITAVAIAE
jgi:hypothetical protein